MVFGGGVIPRPFHEGLVEMTETLELQFWKRESRWSEITFFTFIKTLDNFVVKELRPFSDVVFKLLGRICRHLEAGSISKRGKSLSRTAGWRLLLYSLTTKTVA